MKQEQKDLVRTMKLNSGGWKVIEDWSRTQIDSWTKALIEENNESTRGMIKGMKSILKKVDQLSKKQEE